MFREALDYPTRPPRGGRAVLVGGTLSALVGALVAGAVSAFADVDALDPAYASVGLLALLPWLCVRGYYVRVLRRTAGYEYPTPPPFRDARRLLRDGAGAASIAAGYLLPAAVVLGPLVFARTRTADFAAFFGGTAPALLVDAALAAVGILAMFAALYLIGALYVLPVAVANFAYTGSLRAAFDVRTVLSGAATEDYVVAWVISLLLQALLLPVAYLLKAILIGFYLQFLVAVGVRYCYGRGVGRALGLEPLAPDVAARAGEDDAAVEPAVRPIEESEVPELQPDPEQEDPFEYPYR